ncbi:alkaline phosphatase family protein [Humibacter sp.]|uniref:alkaline phosphatase family protein n=1 Tax=Humibacter sp. TaxID=1940291 RepID=UPI002B5689C9|nr:alkaline phosphatase family protein [Humibacter sp.]HVX06979.1 alkaline phosphatase family protein [Humibacter sp.]
MSIRAKVIAAVILTGSVVLALAGCAPGPSGSGPGTTGAGVPSASASAPADVGQARTPRLQHVVVIMDENKPSTSVIGNPDAPYLNALAQAGARASHYSAITHPSLPNYLALTAGSTAGITADCAPGPGCLATGHNLAEELDRGGLTWKMYAESMPAPCTASDAGLYVVRHNPFLYFPSVTRDSSYCRAHDVPFDRLKSDLSTSGALPDFSFVSPNLCDDMHNCSVATGDAWLATNVPKILDSPAFAAQRSLLVVTFDEGDSDSNLVACVFAGPAARPHAVVSTSFTHYSLLRTVEDALGLAPLTANDARAEPMTQLLDQPPG